MESPRPGVPHFRACALNSPRLDSETPLISDFSPLQKADFVLYPMHYHRERTEKFLLFVRCPSAQRYEAVTFFPWLRHAMTGAGVVFWAVLFLEIPLQSPLEAANGCSNTLTTDQ